MAFTPRSERTRSAILAAARQLQHPNLVTLYNAGRTGPYWWLSLELVEGESLAEVLRRLGPGTPLPWTRGLRLAVAGGAAWRTTW